MVFEIYLLHLEFSSKIIVRGAMLKRKIFQNKNPMWWEIETISKVFVQNIDIRLVLQEIRPEEWTSYIPTLFNRKIV